MGLGLAIQTSSDARGGTKVVEHLLKAIRMIALARVGWCNEFGDRLAGCSDTRRDPRRTTLSTRKLKTDLLGEGPEVMCDAHSL
jgi:hypothetical protein